MFLETTSKRDRTAQLFEFLQEKHQLARLKSISRGQCCPKPPDTSPTFGGSPNNGSSGGQEAVHPSFRHFRGAMNWPRTDS